MALIEKIVDRARSNRQRIVLPESLEERTITAADRALGDGLADIILIGNEAEIFAKAAELGLKNIGKATIIDPETSPKTAEYENLLYELRKNKGMTPEEAHKLVFNPLYFGCLIIKSGDADGQISGALSTTGQTLRPALQIIKCAPGITCVSGAMLLVTKTPQYGEDGVLVVGDVAVTPAPDAGQLAQIAVCTAQTARSVAGFAEPRVAMLSFSTKGSAKHEVVDKVVEATALARELDPTLDLEQFLLFGGYPGGYRFRSSPRRWQSYIRDSILENVLNRDILRLRPLPRPALFRQFLELLSAYPCREISYTKLLGNLQDKGNVEVVKHYLFLLSCAFLYRGLEDPPRSVPRWSPLRFRLDLSLQLQSNAWRQDAT